MEAHTRVLLLPVQQPFLDQGFQGQKRVDIHIPCQPFAKLQVMFMFQVLQQGLLRLQDHLALAHRVLQPLHGVALLFQQTRAKLLDGEDLQTLGHHAIEPDHTVANGNDPGPGIGQHQNARLAPCRLIRLQAFMHSVVVLPVPASALMMIAAAPESSTCRCSSEAVIRGLSQ